MGLSRGSSKRSEHQYVEERLSSYLDGYLSAEERRSIERHLAECPRCQWSYETLGQTVHWTRELPTVTLPRVFTIPVPAQPVRAARRGWGLPVLQAATALVALLFFFAVAGDFVLTGLLPSQAPQLDAVQQMAPLQTEAEEPSFAQPTAASEEVLGEPAEPAAPPGAVEAAESGESAAPRAAEPAELPVMEAEMPVPLPTAQTGALGVKALESVGDAAPKVAAKEEGDAGPNVGAHAIASDAAAPVQPTATAVPTAPPAVATEVSAVQAYQAAESPAVPQAAGRQDEVLRDSLGAWLVGAQLALGFLFVLLGLVTIVLTVRRLGTR